MYLGAGRRLGCNGYTNACKANQMHTMRKQNNLVKKKNAFSEVACLAVYRILNWDDFNKFWLFFFSTPNFALELAQTIYRTLFTLNHVSIGELFFISTTKMGIGTKNDTILHEQIQKPQEFFQKSTSRLQITSAKILFISIHDNR